MTHTLPKQLIRALAIIAVCIWAPNTGAQINTDTLHSTGASHGSAVPIAAAAPRTGPVTIDGRLDEAAWQAAPPITRFTQQQPSEGMSATQRTDVRILYDDGALYIGARMYDDHGAAGVRARLVRRDANANSDLLTIDLDPFRDRLHYAEFSINPSGVRGDALDGDNSWDPVWEGAAHIDSLGWTAEMRIPLSQLRFSRDSMQTWGLEITRLVQRLNEQDLWSFYRLNETGGPAFYGALTGLNLHARPSRLELLPYGVMRAARLTPGNPANTLYDPHQTDLRVGADVKYLVTSNLTLSATANPDCGQVEVDPAVVNLSAFETYFPEKRPFFVEGSSLFRFGSAGCNINCGLGLDLFYSRRIGRAPEGAALAYAAGPYTDIPDNTTILGATKFTGRTAGGYALGVLDAVTRGDVAPVIAADGAHLFQPVEPATNDFVGRVTREMRDGNVVIGGVLTSVYRNLNDPGLASLLDRHAEAAGVDANVWWGGHTYRWYTALTASDVASDSAAVLRLQRSSARYLQRPDREPASNGLFSSAYDPSATALRGYRAITRLAKQGGNWIWDINASSISPGFESNDLGFLRTANWRWVNGSLGRQYTQPTRFYRTLLVMGETEQQWNYDGDVTGHDLSGFVNVELPNYWTSTLFVTRQPSALSDRLTRGGPVVRRAGNWGASLNVATDARRFIVLSTNPNYSRTDDGGFDSFIDLGVTWRPASNLSFSVDPQLTAARTTDQYVMGVPDSTAIAFYGKRYVFAQLDQRAISMTTRASVTFTPHSPLRRAPGQHLSAQDQLLARAVRHPGDNTTE